MAAPVTSQVFDAIVVGAGVSGFSAALALKEKNKRVAIIAKSLGASSVSSGAWDFGTIPRGISSLEEATCSDAWITLYHKVLAEDPKLLNAREFIASAESIKSAIAPELDLQFSFRQCLTLPTSAGSWKRCFGAQALQAKADLNQLIGKKIAFVTCDRWRFRADLILKKWLSHLESTGLALDITLVSLDLPIKGTDWPLPHMASRLQAEETFRLQFLDSLQKTVGGASYDVLLFPPVFLENSFVKTIQNQTNAEVAECLATVEPIAGYRLLQATRKALSRLEIPLLTVSELRPQIEKGSVKAFQVVASHAGSTKTSSEPSSSHLVRGNQFVLASGKLFGGGIALGYQAVKETVFDLPLFHCRTEGPIAYRSELPWDSHPFHEEQPWARLGVWADTKWRPRDSAKGTALENVVVCGSALGGVDYAKEGLGLGFMASTGRQCANVLH